MFWRFGGYATISTVDTLLDKPDVSLEELLDEAELISELKQHNTKLIEYLREDHILKRLMEYVVAPPLINEDDDHDEADDADDAHESDKPAKQGDDDESSEDKDKHDLLDSEDLDRADKQRSKFAYIACEILSSETWSILESIMLNETYLRDFWDFVKRPAPLDSLQAGYFTKINEVLFDKKTEEMLQFFKSLTDVIPSILQHIDNPMVMDLLLKIVSLEKVEGGQGTVDVSIRVSPFDEDYMLNDILVAQKSELDSYAPFVYFFRLSHFGANLGWRLPQGDHHDFCECNAK